MTRRLLIIEYDKSVAKQLKWSLGQEYDIFVAYDLKETKSLLSSGRFPVTILDLDFPPFPDQPLEGLKLLEEIHIITPYTKVIVITEDTKEEIGAKAISLGAVDFCTKPINIKELQIILSRIFRISQLEEIYRKQQEQQIQPEMLCGMISISPSMIKLFDLIKKVSPTDYPVLITGETGTGKEMAVRAFTC